MPEGDTLFRAARMLHEVLAGRVVEGVRAARPLGVYAPRAGMRIEGVEARGKNLLVRFERGPAIHVHLGMHGRVFAAREGSAGWWRRGPRPPSLVIEAEGAVAVVVRASLVRAVRHPDADASLASLGPDVLTEAFDLAEACRRLRALGAIQVGDALLHQQSLAGIGNVYKCEALFMCRVDPFAPLSSIDDTRLLALVTSARDAMRANLGPGRRRTRGAPSALAGPVRPSSPLWVYGRAGRPCLVCGALVRARRAGAHARLTWYCPTCQGVSVSARSLPPTPPPVTSSSSTTSAESSRDSTSAPSAATRSRARSRSRSR